jgi:hypothetical protein
MSTATSATSPTVVRSHTTAHAHHYRPNASEATPQRTRSTATRPSHQGYTRSRSNSRSYSRDDYEKSTTQPRASSSRRSSSQDRVNDDPPPPPYPGPSRRETPRRNDVDRRQAAADGRPHASHHLAAAPNGVSLASQPKRRTTISTPTGQWALGKTIGAGSMGKVKLAKNIETGEQVRLASCFSGMDCIC